MPFVIAVLLAFLCDVSVANWTAVWTDTFDGEARRRRV